MIHEREVVISLNDIKTAFQLLCVFSCSIASCSVIEQICERCASCGGEKVMRKNERSLLKLNSKKAFLNMTWILYASHFKNVARPVGV